LAPRIVPLLSRNPISLSIRCMARVKIQSAYWSNKMYLQIWCCDTKPIYITHSLIHGYFNIKLVKVRYLCVWFDPMSLISVNLSVLTAPFCCMGFLFNIACSIL
jgi:hypothetical protein